MSRIQVDDIYNKEGTGAPTFPVGASVTGVATATSFSGSGSSLTGLTGASAATYGSANSTPVIVVDSNGRITGISTVETAGSGSGESWNQLDTWLYSP